LLLDTVPLIEMDVKGATARALGAPRPGS